MKSLALVLILMLSGCTAVYDKALFEETLRYAEQGNPEAQYLVGMMYNNGMGVRQDPRIALEWFRKATALGDPLGAFKLGCYYGGQFRVVEIDMEKSFEYHLIAAKAGYALAQSTVGDMYFAQEQFDDAATWWKRAAEQGYPEALWRLGGLYQSGRGHIPQDHSLAYAYLKLARSAMEAHRDNPAALKRLDQMLDELTRTMSDKERENAEQVVVSWKPQPTVLTMRAKEAPTITVARILRDSRNR